ARACSAAYPENRATETARVAARNADAPSHGDGAQDCASAAPARTRLNAVRPSGTARSAISLRLCLRHAPRSSASRPAAMPEGVDDGHQGESRDETGASAPQDDRGRQAPERALAGPYQPVALARRDGDLSVRRARSVEV